MTGIVKEMQGVVADIIDDEAAASSIVYALLKRFGGSQLYIPANDYALRNQEIKELYAKKVSVEVLAIRFKLSDKTIYRIIKTK